jgi:transcriptional regulator with XRE-family HTH domain
MNQNAVTLAELIRSHQDSTAESYSVIAARAGLSKAKIGQLAIATQNSMPRAETLEKLAKGLRQPLRVIQQAAMASAGLTPEGTGGQQRVDILAAALRELSTEDLETVSAVINSLRDRRKIRPARSA